VPRRVLLRIMNLPVGFSAMDLLQLRHRQTVILCVATVKPFIGRHSVMVLLKA
jgi:hypothetical protein